MFAPVLAAALATAPAAAPTSGPVSDDRLVVESQNVLGQQGLVRTTSALVGAPTLGVNTRLFVSPDFLLPDVGDADTFLEGQVGAGFSAWNIVEVAIASRAAANLNAARAQPTSSVGDLDVAVKGSYRLGVVAVAGDVRVGLPTRANKVGVDLNNLATTIDGIVTVDLLPSGLPLRAHLNGGYTLRGANRAKDAKATYLLDGPDGALLALATQQWFYDTAHAGLGVEVPLPYVTPFVETWFETAAGAEGYDVASDSWLIVTPGVRVGAGGLRLDVAADVGVLGNAGGLAPQASAVVDGQPLNPLWALRVGVSHSFGGAGGGGGGGSLARLEGCVKDVAGPIKGAIVAVGVDGQPGPRLVAGDDGCFGVPLQPGNATLTVVDADHVDGGATVAVVAGQTARVEVVLAPAPRQAHVVGFLTSKEDEPVDASLVVVDDGGERAPVASAQGAYDVQVRPGHVVVIARADGYLARGVDLVVRDGERRAASIVLSKVPKKRSVQLTSSSIETSGPLPFEFKKPRLLSAAVYPLDEIADVLLANPALKISIEAHTDVSEAADPAAAQALTDARALAVKDALVARGVAAARLTTRGFGTSQPLGPQDRKNRRVELNVVP
jgi:outer membrane protein OmpA-like peptidoglycan-associated protein